MSSLSYLLPRLVKRKKQKIGRKSESEFFKRQSTICFWGNAALVTPHHSVTSSSWSSLGFSEQLEAVATLFFLPQTSLIGHRLRWKLTSIEKHFPRGNRQDGRVMCAGLKSERFSRCHNAAVAYTSIARSRVRWEMCCRPGFWLQTYQLIIQSYQKKVNTEYVTELELWVYFGCYVSCRQYGSSQYYKRSWIVNTSNRLTQENIILEKM